MGSRYSNKVAFIEKFLLKTEETSGLQEQIIVVN